ncbi:hypothetical protein [Kocuria rhizophila]|uniref:hypothetical protein n=1 Tax=Kocuria rhizophila TaxID=72000 RepID=UPI00190B5ABF|nr:hypothetical protein [Kocuria rhizophila]MBK4121035.1 hypothetical protein [Kocuria rhizophila]MCC5673170.1 hypothetical protein [Kocuria rhizophila]
MSAPDTSGQRGGAAASPAAAAPSSSPSTTEAPGTDAASPETPTPDTTSEAPEPYALTMGVRTFGAATVSVGANGVLSTTEIETAWSAAVSPAPTEVYSVAVRDSTGADDATVTCSLLRDGTTVDEKTASGPFALVTCTDPR